jgi:8-oxo-dGTP pyrophosphatase MutT (NUDIX family)
MVALVDRSGAVLGSAERSVVRRDNLMHSATAVLVRDPEGRIYVHRRSPDKDWAPGCHDAAAGGVLTTGEQPAESAARELAEELGITGAPMTPLPHARYDDGRVRYHAFTYEVRWDGPLRPEPTEIAWAGWVTLNELVERLADPERWPFAPDGRAGIERWLAARTDP